MLLEIHLTFAFNLWSHSFSSKEFWDWLKWSTERGNLKQVWVDLILPKVIQQEETWNKVELIWSFPKQNLIWKGTLLWILVTFRKNMLEILFFYLHSLFANGKSRYLIFKKFYMYIWRKNIQKCHYVKTLFLSFQGKKNTCGFLIGICTIVI